VRTALLALILAAAPALGAQDATPTPTPVPKRTPRGGSSLADMVKRSQERSKPKETKKSLGVISNESLKPSSGKKTLNTVDGKISAPQGVPTPSEIVLKDNNGRTEQEWRERAKTLRNDVAGAKERVSKFETEAKRLENDFYAWSDGNYRDNVIKPSWDRAREDLKKARTDLDSAQTALDGLADEARKAGAPPGWIR
jgi:DNA repair exonuclease SbcCD ATPase subunit